MCARARISASLTWATSIAGLSAVAPSALLALRARWPGRSEWPRRPARSRLASLARRPGLSRVSALALRPAAAGFAPRTSGALGARRACAQHAGSESVLRSGMNHGDPKCITDIRNTLDKIIRYAPPDTISTALTYCPSRK